MGPRMGIRSQHTSITGETAPELQPPSLADEASLHPAAASDGDSETGEGSGRRPRESVQISGQMTSNTSQGVEITFQ